MTTAHRPTWKAAVGRSQESSGAVSTQRSALDAPSHTKLKVRPATTTAAGAASASTTRTGNRSSVNRDAIVQESLRKLQQVESQYKKNKLLGIARKIDPKIEEEARVKMLMATAEIDDVAIRKKYDDSDEVENGSNVAEEGGGWSDVDDDNLGNTNDDSDLDASDSDLDDGDDEDNDSEDEEAALQAELAKIREERERAKAKAEAEAVAEEQSRMEEAALVGNPLLNVGTAMVGSGKLKRRWNDDVVFRNQAKGEPQQIKRFINDTVRNDFHKRFIRTYFK